ncbi:hypothetical protein CW304_32860 [Bacillus sp. UFRGS-B20]|nr:hypothetical protein CW304_32860 [Bacillus sp. UFRGS-B20]
MPERFNAPAATCFCCAGRQTAAFSTPLIRIQPSVFTPAVKSPTFMNPRSVGNRVLVALLIAAVAVRRSPPVCLWSCCSNKHLPEVASRCQDSLPTYFSRKVPRKLSPITNTLMTPLSSARIASDRQPEVSKRMAKIGGFTIG